MLKFLSLILSCSMKESDSSLDRQKQKIDYVVFLRPFTNIYTGPFLLILSGLPFTNLWQ